MSTSIREAYYKDVKSIVLENTCLAVTVIPESGGKIQSIYDKRLEKEYLYQSEQSSYVFSSYDSCYGEGDASGFDEVFPSIEACFYPMDPWRGVAIPDHGEVWALPWDWRVEENALVLGVNGIRFPYRLEKRIDLIGENTIGISYKAENLSAFDFRFIWAPHLLLECGPESKIILPQSVERVMSTCSVDNKLGRFGTFHDWPVTEIGGESYRIDKVYPKYAGKCEKYYVVGKLKEGWCALRDDETGHEVRLTFPVDKVPYLGVWEGIVDGRYVTALEPCTGALDDLGTAIQWNQAGIIPAKSSCDWFLHMTFDHFQNMGLQKTEDIR